MNSQELRLGIVGAAGTGRSSLAHALAEHLSIKLIESKTITKPIIERDGYDYSSGIQIERFLACNARQLEILNLIIVAQSTVSSFVTDRTVVDLTAYAVAELHDGDITLLRKIFYACKKHSAVYTHLFMCPWTDAPIKGNNLRTLNPWYQFQIHALDEGIMDDWGLKYHTLKANDTESRLKEVLAVLADK